MTRQCTVCVHPQSFEINEELIVEGRGVRNISKRFDVSSSAVQRHKSHIPELLLKAYEDMSSYDATTILRKIRKLEEETLEQLQGAKDDEDRRFVLAAIREQRGNLELVARVAKLISDAPTINILQNPQWVEVRSVVIRALAAHPSARESVVRALEEMGDA